MKRFLFLFFILILLSFTSATWWDTDFPLKRPISIMNDGNVLDSNFTIQFIANTAGFISDGNMQADCDDLRIVDENTNLEVDRNVMFCNNAETVVEFPLNNSLQANVDYNNTYYMYYGNAGASAGPGFDNQQTADYNLSKGAANINAWYEFEDNINDSMDTFNGTGDFDFVAVPKFGAKAGEGDVNGWIVSADILPTRGSAGAWFNRNSQAWADDEFVINMGATASALLFSGFGKPTISETPTCPAVPLTNYHWVNWVWDEVEGKMRVYIDNELCHTNDAWTGNLNDSTSTMFVSSDLSTSPYDGSAYVDQLYILDLPIQIFGGGGLPLMLLGDPLDVNMVVSDFIFNPISILDSNITYDFTDTSDFLGSDTNAWVWDINSVTFSTDQNTSRSLLRGDDYNICLTAIGKIPDGNLVSDQSCQTLSASAGSIKMYFTDENTGTVLPNVTGTFNSVSYAADSNGFIEFDLFGLSDGSYTVTALDVNHSTRLFSFTLKSLDNFVVNAALVGDNKGNNIGFQFYGSDETTLLTDSNVTIVNLENGRTVYRQQKTDDSGKVTFFLNPNDSQYEFIITGEVEDVTYGSIDFIVKSPKREADGSLITPINFDAHLTGTGDTLFSDASGDVTFKIYGNTFTKYKLSIDVNAEFFERKYDIRVRGDTDPFTLQPYLVSAAEGVSTKIVTQSSLDFSPIGQVTVNIFKFITGEGRILIESVITDDKGEAFISGITNDEYEFEVFFQDELIATPSITVTSSVIFIQFNPFTFDIEPIESQVSVIFNPNRQKLISGENILTQTISIRNGSIDTIRIFTLDENFSAISYDLTFGGVSDGLTNTISVIPDLNGWDANSIMYLTVRVTYEGRTEDFNMIYMQYQPFKSGDVVLNILMNLIRIDVGCSSDSDETCPELVFIALILTILLCGALVVITPLRDPSGIIGMSMLFIAFFTFLGWVPLLWFVAYCFVGFAGMLSLWRML